MATVDHTKLQLVNDMLAVVKEGPVTTTTQTRGSSLAEQILDQTDHEIQSIGWHFNTEYDVTLSPSGGVITLDTDVLRVNPQNFAKDYIELNGQLYDLNNNTATITNDVKVTIVRFRNINEIPKYAADAIRAVASRKFQIRHLGSLSLDRILREEEERAMQTLMVAEKETRDANLLRDNFSISRTLSFGLRRNPLFVE